MSQETDPPPTKISNMTYPEIVAFYNAKLGRVEMAWFRIMYLHAAMVGVLVFFSEAEQFYMLQRAFVFGFFTVNLVIFVLALRESHEALESARKDLARFPESDGHVDQWFRKRKTSYNSPIRSATLFATWALFAFLLFRSLIFS